MKNLKVYNRIFTDAWSSFSLLELYYGEMVALLHRRSSDFQEYVDQLEVEYKQKQREFDKQTWLRHYDVYSALYPRFFNNSFLISACSLFEYQVKKICALIKKEHELPIDWEDMEGTVLAKTRRYLRFAGVVLTDSPAPFIPAAMPGSRMMAKVLWQEIENTFMIRNCITHHNGVIEETRNPDRVKKYAAEKGLLLDKAGRQELLLHEKFNREICNTMEEFFHKLTSAYYGTPLPK
ncbi:MAG: hypothetical protein HY670_04090 [Chloroflexi bacterium]|nr:hypothetical protein [Chloroflexota bacterium]